MARPWGCCPYCRRTSARLSGIVRSLLRAVRGRQNAMVTQQQRRDDARPLSREAPVRPDGTANESSSGVAAWTRSDWESRADRLLAGARAWASPAHAAILLPGPVSASGAWSDGLEGFARTFLLAAMRIKGAGGADPEGLLDWYAQGLIAGVDPGHPECWPTMARRRQVRVEAASLAIGLSETREWLWDQLPQRTREQAIDWLSAVVGTSDYRNNWLWFQDVIETFLQSVGGPWSDVDFERNDALRESLYVGDGWYSDGRRFDGARQTFDYYAGWAWHVYPLLTARMRGEELSLVHRERLNAYLGQLLPLLGDDGDPLFHGRSLIYRFAVMAPVWAGALTGATPLQPGETRAVTSAVGRRFWEAGAVREDGTLSLGWHGEFPGMRQLYSSGSSPYWSSKAFLGLLLPPEHAVWRAPVGERGAWSAPGVTTLEVPGWVVSRTDDGVVRAFNHGSDRIHIPRPTPRADDPFYARLGYSSHTAPQLDPQRSAQPLDSCVALLDTDSTPSHRDAIDRILVANGVGISASWTHWQERPGSYGSQAQAGEWATGWSGLRRGPRLLTASVVRGPCEVRLAVVVEHAPQPGPVGRGEREAVAHEELTAAWPADPGPWRLHMGGWALAADSAEDLASETASDGENPAVRVSRKDGLHSRIVGLIGLERGGLDHAAGADPFGPYSVTPWLRTEMDVVPGQVYAALVTLGRPRPEDLGVLDLEVRTSLDGPFVSITWSDEVRQDVVLGPVPA